MHIFQMREEAQRKLRTCFVERMLGKIHEQRSKMNASIIYVQCVQSYRTNGIQFSSEMRLVVLGGFVDG